MEKYRTVCMVRFELCFKICVRDKQPNNKRGKSINRHFVEKQTRTAGRNNSGQETVLVTQYRNWELYTQKYLRELAPPTTTRQSLNRNSSTYTPVPSDCPLQD